MELYDIAIIGSGPAGVSAALNAKILDKNFIWLASGSTSRKVERAELVKNYPGLPDVTGAELSWALKNHAESMGVFVKNAVVSGIYETRGKYTLLADGLSYDARTVILCIGAQPSKTVVGEEKFLGRGISYCATCDGFLYKGKTIAVVCTDKSFEHEIEFLCSVAKKAYVIPLYKDYAVAAPNAEVVLKAPTAYEGGSRLERVVFKDGVIEVDGAFLLKGFVSPTSLAHGLETENGHIRVDRRCATNLAGIFAAGDCTGRPYQYIKAAGEGNVAVHSAAEYLSKL